MRKTRSVTIKRADTEAKQIKGPQKEAKGDNKTNVYRSYTDLRPAGEGEGRH